MQLINRVSSGEQVIAMDPSYNHKAGKCTFGRGKYWSGVARAAKWGFDFCGFAVVGIVFNTVLHLSNGQKNMCWDEIASSFGYANAASARNINVWKGLGRW